jgi:hypothetical protein
MLENLFYLFCFLSIFAVGLAYYYNKHGHLTGAPFPYSNIAQLSLGNIGSAQAICLSQFLNLKKERTLSCEKGFISELVHYGVHTGGE